MRKLVVVPRKPQACWLGFTDPDTMCAWVPTLRSATVLSKRPDGMPHEIEFELTTGRRYTLAYTYAATDIAKIVRWEPTTNTGDAVRGFARFEPAEDGGTQITYELEEGASRTELERALASADEVLDAFVEWMTDSNRPQRR